MACRRCPRGGNPSLGLSLMQPGLTQSRFQASAQRTPALTSPLPSRNTIIKLVVRQWDLASSDYPDNFSVVVVNRPSFINPHERTGASHSLFLSFSPFLRPTLSLLVRFLLRPARTRPRAGAFRSEPRYLFREFVTTSERGVRARTSSQITGRPR